MTSVFDEKKNPSHAATASERYGPDGLDHLLDALAVEGEARLAVVGHGDDGERRRQPLDEAEPLEADSLALQPVAQPAAPVVVARAAGEGHRAALPGGRDGHVRDRAPEVGNERVRVRRALNVALAHEVDDRLAQAQDPHERARYRQVRPSFADGKRPDGGTHDDEVDGVSVFVRGEAPAPGDVPVLYLHGVPTNSDDWLPFLARTGGLAPDLPGFGRSGKRGDFDYSIAGYDRFIERLLDHLGIDRVRLVMHDWGDGRARVRPARSRAGGAHRDRRRRPVPARLQVAPDRPGVADARARGARDGDDDPPVGTPARAPAGAASAAGRAGPAWRARGRTSTTAPSARSCASTAARRRTSSPRRAPALPTLDVPALVVWGGRDPYIATSFAEAFAATLPQGRARRAPGGRALALAVRPRGRRPRRGLPDRLASSRVRRPLFAPERRPCPLPLSWPQGSPPPTSRSLPASADLAAQLYRADVFTDRGFAIWDGQWYGGSPPRRLQRALPAARVAARARAWSRPSAPWSRRSSSSGSSATTSATARAGGRCGSARRPPSTSSPDG